MKDQEKIHIYHLTSDKEKLVIPEYFSTNGKFIKPVIRQYIESDAGLRYSSNKTTFKGRNGYQIEKTGEDGKPIPDKRIRFLLDINGDHSVYRDKHNDTLFIYDKKLIGYILDHIDKKTVIVLDKAPEEKENSGYSAFTSRLESQYSGRGRSPDPGHWKKWR